MPQPDNECARPLNPESARSLVFAEAAQARMREHGQAPIPRNYEIWYTYVTGTNCGLTRAVDEACTRTGRLSESDLERIHDAHLSPAGLVRRVDKVSDGIGAELHNVVDLITGALRSTSTYNDSLAEASRGLIAADDHGSIESVVRSLAASTLEVQEDSRRLRNRLDEAIKEIATLQQGLEVIRVESRTDSLTELGNRKHFDDTISKAIHAAGERGEQLSLLMLDIDHFKLFNDTHGHLTGDQVLRLVAMSLKQNIKDKDFAARYGGEEFAVVLPGTSLKQSIAVAERIRRAVMARELRKKSTAEIFGRITVSVGVATLSARDTTESLIERADSCLYSAKRDGRNRVVGHVDPQSHSAASARVA